MSSTSCSITASVIATSVTDSAILLGARAQGDACGVNAMGESGAVKVAYDGKDMELMVVGPIHERRKELIGSFITEISVGLDSRGKPRSIR
jgi:hypothetical protein